MTKLQAGLDLARTALSMAAKRSAELWAKALDRCPAGIRERVEVAQARLAAARGTLAHHAEVWREARALERLSPRREPAGRAEMAFLPAAVEISETPVSPAPRVIGLLILATFVFAVAWACLAHLDIVATASGKVIPSDDVKIIQPLETSIVRGIEVEEGQAVKKGDVLIRLEVTGAKADADRLRGDLNAERAQIARLEALGADDPLAAFSPPPDLPAPLVAVQRTLLVAQVTEQKAKLASLDGELARRRAELKTTETDVARLKALEVSILDQTQRRRILASKGFGSEIERLRSEQELSDNQGQQKVQTAKLAETRAAIVALRAQRDQARDELRRDAADKLSEAKTKAASLTDEAAKAAERNRIQTLTAPVDGTAQELAIHTIGGVVQPAQKLLVVVPKNSRLMIEGRLSNTDIGFVEVGQQAEIKVDAFPFTRYGTLKGRVETVSLDAIQDEEKKEFYFPVRVSIAEPAIRVEGGKRIPLIPGMTVKAEIRTGTRRPIEYVLEPLQKYGSESGRER